MEALLRACGRGDVVLCGAISEFETGERIVNTTTTTARRVDGGFVINGKKLFRTNPPAVTHFRSSAAWASPEGPRIVNLLCRRESAGWSRSTTGTPPVCGRP